MLHSGSSDNYRPSRVRAMFASRACRMSIMIGRKLDQKTMGKVVRQLSGLDQPWNW
jgi:DNA mismatch repair protein PMS2